MKNVITLCACFLLIFATISCSFVFISNNSSDMYAPRKLEDFIIMFSEQGILFKFDKTKLFYEDQLRLLKEHKELIDKFQNDAFNPDDFTIFEVFERIWAFCKWIAAVIWQVLQIIFTLFALIFGVIFDLFEFILCIFNILNFLFYPVKV